MRRFPWGRAIHHILDQSFARAPGNHRSGSVKNGCPFVPQLPDTVTVNGESRELQVPPDMPLVWALREELGLVGTKLSCGIGLCGACTVHVAGKAVRSCVTAIGDVAGPVTTIEGLDPPDGLHPVQKAWIDNAVAQCVFCQSGFIMAAAALLEENPHPKPAELSQQLTNICRCSTFSRIRAAVMAAAERKVKEHG